MASVGSIPSEIAYLSGLTQLKVVGDGALGALPSSFTALSRLRSLQVVNGGITGTCNSCLSFRG